MLSNGIVLWCVWHFCIQRAETIVSALNISAYVNTVRLLPPDNFPYDQIPGGRNYHWRDGHKKVYFYYYKDWIIWGLTAYVLRGVMRTLKAELPGIECGNLVV